MKQNPSIKKIPSISRPFTGAWIETIMRETAATIAKTSPLHGGVD